jgi:2-phospho-L-lactate/phosphoenolpyruvate guanylyltransferase
VFGCGRGNDAPAPILPDPTIRSMPTTLILPVKRLPDAKTRLAPLLARHQRRELMEALVAQTLETLTEVGADAVCVATSDERAADLARARGAGVLDDAGLPWNEGLRHAIDQLPDVDTVAIVAGDLPLLTADDVRALLAAVPSRGVAIGRARDGGTNALCLRPPDLFVPSFGAAASASVHAGLASAAGVPAAIVDRQGLALDLDTPDDVAAALAAGLDGSLGALLRGYRNRSEDGSRTSSAAEPSPR